MLIWEGALQLAGSLTCAGACTFADVWSLVGAWNFAGLMTQACFFAVLAAVAWVDSRTRKIPDGLVLLALLCGLLAFFTLPGLSAGERIGGALAVSLPLFLAALLFPGALGGGDVKLMAACGLFLGTEKICRSFVWGIGLAALYGLWLVAVKKRGKTARFALGPFLCAGMLAESIESCVRFL